MISEHLPEKDYWPDVSCTRLFYYDGQRYSKDVIIEVDYDSHKSDMSRVKDNRCDRHYLSLGIHKVRFPLARVIGKRAWPDGAILDLIEKKMEYQLK